MERNRTFVRGGLGIVVVLALASGACGRWPTGSEGEGATMVGRVSHQSVSVPAAPSHLVVTVNGEARDVAVAADGSFALPSLPLGDVTIGIEVDGISDVITLRGVSATEIIEVSVIVGPGRLSVDVVRRDVPDGVGPPPPAHRGTIAISGKHLVYYFEPGVYEGDVVVTGHHITLLGAADVMCTAESQTVITGRLIVAGHHIRVVNLQAQGGVQLSGHHVRFYDACTPAPMSTSDWSDDGWGRGDDGHGERHDS